MWKSICRGEKDAIAKMKQRHAEWNGLSAMRELGIAIYSIFK